MSLYTITFSTIVKRSTFKDGLLIDDRTEFKQQTMTGLPLRVALQYDKQPDFKITAEVPTSDRRAKAPRTPSLVNWNGGGKGTRTLRDDSGRPAPRAAKADAPKDTKLEAARTGDLGAAISEAA